MDTANQQVIWKYINESDFNKRRWKKIAEIILSGHKNREFYDDETGDYRYLGTATMKFVSNREHSGLYCKECSTKDGRLMIVAAEIYRRKQSDTLTHIEIIKKIGQYEYQIE